MAVVLTIETGAYFALGEHLYYVLEVEEGANGGVACENCRTGYITRLTSAELSVGRQVHPTPWVVPDAIPDGE